ncbi:hypothetical protein ACOSQ2_029107 [Xanthoceras sorbifolium]
MNSNQTSPINSPSFVIINATQYPPSERVQRAPQEWLSIWAGGPDDMGRRPRHPGRRPRRIRAGGPGDPGRRPRRYGQEAQASGQEAQADPGRWPRRSGQEAQADPGRSGAMTPMRSPGVRFREIRGDDPDEEPRCGSGRSGGESINTREKKNCVRAFSYKCCCNSSFIVD